MTNKKQCIKKQRYNFANRGPSRKDMVFPVVMDECESWTIKSLWITPSMAAQVLNHYALLLKEFLKEVFITCSYNLVLVSDQNLA